MYDRVPGLTLGYHGCDRKVCEAVLSGRQDLRTSRNLYDWLGNGIYFWEHNPKRALDWASGLASRPFAGRAVIREPAVLGAVIDLGFCLNLLDVSFLEQLPSAYEQLAAICAASGTQVPANRKARGSNDLLLRHLDCAVIETLHQLRQDEQQLPFDSARGVFTEGEPLYPGAAIQKGNHIQICIRNPACIKGYFRLRDA